MQGGEHADLELVEAIRRELAAAGDPERAAGQQAYMKSALPYYGIASPELRRIVNPLLRGWLPRDRDTWEATLRELWDTAGHREDRYVALAMARHRRARDWQTPSVLGLYRHLAVTGAWWDLVDELATRVVGPVLAEYRDQVTGVMDAWAVEDDMWLRRVAILCQLKHKADTDVALLERSIAANLEGSEFGSEFFIRKAIGWALREHAKTDAEWVRDFLTRHDANLSGLSRREAARHL